jgi:hypothetical protein
MVIDRMLDQLKDMYQAGTINGCDRAVAERWDMERVVGDLYIANWVDYRFAPDITNFLIAITHGQDYILISVPTNLVHRHYVASTLSDNNVPFQFSDEYVKIPVSGLRKARVAASLTDSAIIRANGQVLTLSTANIDMLYLYGRIVMDMYPIKGLAGTDKGHGGRIDMDYNYVNYERDDTEKMFVFSLRLPMYDDISGVTEKISTRADQMIIQAERDYPGKNPFKVLLS